MAVNREKRLIRTGFTMLVLCLLLAVSPVSARAAAAAKRDSRPFRYIALGNSVTCHPVCDFWFYECGMGASVPSKDYVHQTVKKIRKLYGKYYSSYSFDLPDYLWELSASARKALKKELGKSLKKNVQLLTFQYGDNIRDLAFFEKSLTGLIRFVKKVSPETKIVIVGNTDLSSKVCRRVEAVKKKVAKRCGTGFADLSPIMGKAKYQLGFTRIKDSKGNWHRVTMGSVAAHPNDRGMEWIASRIVSEYEKLVNVPEEIQAQEENRDAGTDSGQQAAAVTGENTETKQQPQLRTGVHLIRGKLYYYSAKGKYDAARTKRLRKYAKAGKTAAPLVKLLKRYGCRRKKAEFFGKGCLGNSEDGIYTFAHFRMQVIRYADGEVRILGFVSR